MRAHLGAQPVGRGGVGGQHYVGQLQVPVHRALAVHVLWRGGGRGAGRGGTGRILGGKARVHVGVEHSAVLCG
jgi:hypothetical protein